MTGTIDSIKRSLAYRNVKAAMTVVFGINGWAVNTIWPLSNADDFWLSVDIGGSAQVAYLSVADTHTEGMQSCGPGGSFGASVPVDHKTFFVLPDGRSHEDVADLVGTSGEQHALRFGANGDDVLSVATYLRILKRYLEGVPTSSVPDPNSEHVGSLAGIGAPAMTEHLGNALDSTFGNRCYMNDIVRIRHSLEYWAIMALDQMSRAGYFRLTIPSQGESGHGMCLMCTPSRDGAIVFPDGVRGDDVAVLVGTPEERERFEGGVDGGDAAGMTEYMNIFVRSVYHPSFVEGWKQLLPTERQN